MRHLDLDWTEFFEALPLYRRLSVRAREQFITNGPYASAIRTKALEPSLDEFLQLGMFSYTTTGKTAAINPALRGFCIFLRALHRSRIDVEPGAASLDSYLANNFTREEWTALYGRSMYWRQDRGGLYEKIASRNWIEEFLRSESEAWQSQFILSFAPAPAEQSVALEALKKLIRQLMKKPQPLQFEELLASSPDRDALAGALSMGLRYALLFPMLRRDTMEPVLGLWPEITAHLHRPAAKAPEPVTPAHTFTATLDVDVMIAVLTACAAEPLRLLATGWTELYQKSEKQVAARITPLPDWLGGLVTLNDNFRIQGAVARLVDLDLAQVAMELMNDRRLEITDKGRAWLGLHAKDRLKLLLDRVRNAKRGNTMDESDSRLAPSYWFSGTSVDIESLVREAFARIPAAVHIRFKDFVTYEAREHNGLRKGRMRSTYGMSVSGRSIQTANDKELEQAWSDILGRTLGRLMEFGAMELGVVEEQAGRSLTVALTPAGQYLLGMAPDFTVENIEAPGAIVVQANFDVVFMAPSPAAEAELGSFTERHGKHVGVVLKITKKSIWAAASAGIQADRVIELLRKYSSAPLPANVDREIRGWMAQCRRATVRQAMLIECPDEETATRVAALDRARLTKISSTIVELNNASERARVAKKLREMGVFL